ncbi:hypothetical protein KsCSTR_10540 [Candidatus Kuenenia stuttgartiensis]|uniref:Uncharacterized protein n=1 Tax=Kuenenia stuttgartiensis TaxID=174633 RepID=Q1PYP2_KUEST|nr:hypothetical protein KsCSTR_10540 [Candidatus Kuenenia stuttgartiensis]CAJ72207.1 unknown protein [Candidatus Kuenenia stuttgartiensis]
MNFRKVSTHTVLKIKKFRKGKTFRKRKFFGCNKENTWHFWRSRPNLTKLAGNGAFFYFNVVKDLRS